MTALQGGGDYDARKEEKGEKPTFPRGKERKGGTFLKRNCSRTLALGLAAESGTGESPGGITRALRSP